MQQQSKIGQPYFRTGQVKARVRGVKAKSKKRKCQQVPSYNCAAEKRNTRRLGAENKSGV